jgi:hypothetical protein
MFSMLNYREKYLSAVSLIAKLQTVILLDIITCDGDDVKADVSVCCGRSVYPKFLNYFLYMFTFGYFGYNF